MPISRRVVLCSALAAAAAGVVGVTVVAPSVVRSRATDEARRHGLSVEIGSVHLGWFQVSLDRVSLRPLGWDGADAEIERLRVPFSASFQPRAVEALGGTVRVRGTASEVSEGVGRWRRGVQAGSAGASGGALPISVEGLSVEWSRDGVSVGQVLGLRLRRDSSGATIEFDSAQSRVRQRVVSATGARAQLNAAHAFVGASVSAISVGLEARKPQADGPPSPSPSTATPEGLPAEPADAGRPLVSLPDFRRIRALASTLVNVLADRVATGAAFRVNAFSFEVGNGSPPEVLSLGPGELALTRDPTAFALNFVMGHTAKTPPLSFSAALPTDGRDITLRLQGGPVSLAALGVREGQWGLVDADRATVAGRIDLALGADDGSLTFDAEGTTSGVALHEARLAPDVVRGLDLALRARGLASHGEIRLDDFAARLGAIQLSASGDLVQENDHVSGSLRMQVPSAPCQAVLDSFPSSLLPAIEGAKLAGTFGGRGEISFDTRTLDDLRLDYEIQDGCHVTSVPEPLSREHFRSSFSHRIYLPDGSTTDVETGPGTKDWTPLEAISPYMQVAVLTTEDGAFLKHRGFNRGAIRASLIANLKARRFVRGASTITMQTAKNLFLSREKTISRKLEEVALTEYLEQAFSKSELMELYLNVIEFGPGVYGVGPAADFYFGRTPGELNLAECLFLSSLLPSPIRYSRMHDADQVPDGWMKSLRSTMRMANKRGLITDAELAEGQGETVVFWHGGPRPDPRPPVPPRASVNEADSAEDAPLPALVP